FAFTASEQEFFAQKGYTNEPGRCPDCRAARKVERPGGFNGRRDREMFPATCGRCGKATQVPFQPRNDRPVYCPECYSAQRPSGGYDRRPSGAGRSSGSRW
ncbi:MAG: zinc-ribbon domain containing protein, partial [Dehalococcoidia bacterium]|nr:zinc-ribbon domain containing protein [Dehalococcoidia bacterium]